MEKRDATFRRPHSNDFAHAGDHIGFCRMSHIVCAQFVKHTFNPRVLRNYDVRGEVGVTLTEDDAWALGRSFGTVLRRRGGNRIAVGQDGRLSSSYLATAVIRGLEQTGCTVLEIGLGPTPMLYFAEEELQVHGGIQITGSRHSAEYNGLKMVLGHASFVGDDIQLLARLAESGDWEDKQGDVVSYNIEYAYVERLLQDFSFAPHKIAWDAGNGAAGRIIELLVERLPGEHQLICTEIDGHFPNRCPDPTIEANLSGLRRTVVEHGLEFGFAFDGDGDRIAAVNAQGRILSFGDLLAVLAGPIVKRRPRATIIGDACMDAELRDRLTRIGGTPLSCEIGRSRLKAKMKDCGSPLAGEKSGHFFFKDRWYGFDDAIYTALRYIEAIDECDSSPITSNPLELQLL